MALTPEDVINKRFQPTKFREGYDQDEVDDFLDEIVVELRRLNQENAELREQLEAAGRGVTVTETVVESASVEPAPVPVVEQPVVPEPVAAPVLPSVETSVVGGAENTQSAAGVLAMAQKLHDDYVAQGQKERDRLINEGKAQATELVSEARRTKEETLSSLEQERAELEARVTELQAFESEYRSNIKSFIQGQLREIESVAPLSPALPNGLIQQRGNLHG